MEAVTKIKTKIHDFSSNRLKLRLKVAGAMASSSAMTERPREAWDVFD